MPLVIPILRWIIFVVMILTALANPAMAGSAWKQVAKISIVGNDTLSDSTILRIAGVQSGYMLREGLLDDDVREDLALIEWRLRDSGKFIVDWKLGIRPTVTISRDDGWFKSCDIVITVEERPSTWMDFAPFALVLIAVTGYFGAVFWVSRRISGSAKK